jgi:hypothetical protein
MSPERFVKGESERTYTQCLCGFWFLATTFVCEDDELGCGEVGRVSCEGDASDFSELTRMLHSSFLT